MTTATTAKIISLAPLALLVACGTAPPELPSEPETVVGVHQSSFANSAWSDPVNLGAPVNSACQDQTPTLSSDKLALYFLSDRPGGLGNLVPTTGCLDNFDLWVARRASRESPWGTAVAVNLGPVVNTTANEGAPALSIDGHLLFFTSDREGGQGQNDIYLSRRADPRDDLGWGHPVNLGLDVNTDGFQGGPSYLESAEDGRANLYFFSGPDNNTGADIYYAPVTRDGETLAPAVLVSELSLPGIPDGFPTVRADGREILFNSGRPGGINPFDLWVSTRRSVHDAWSTPEPVGAPVNSQFAEFQPELSHDGRTLLFIAGAGRGGLGRFDIWMSTRTPSGHENPL